MARLQQNIQLASANTLRLALSLALLHYPGSRAGASLSPPSLAFVKLPTATPQFPNRTTSTRTTDLGAAAPPRPSHGNRQTARLSAADSSNGRGDEHIDRGGGGAGPPASATGADIATSSTSTVPAVPVPKSVDLTADGSNSVVEKSPNLGAYWSILRPHNIPASFGLVAAGALVASHSPSSLLDSKVLLTAWAAASVAVGSCVLNDWFDIDLDRLNEPHRPLVTGEVVPAHALAIGVGFLLGAVASAWAVHPIALQATIVASVALTFAYTPLLKPIPVVKNFVVSTVVAAAIAAGGLAAGASAAATLTPSVLTFFVIAHREILMDIADVEGDKEGGVRTLPVLLGRPASLRLATALLTVGVGWAGLGILVGTTGIAQVAAVVLSCLFVLPLYNNLLRVARSDFSKEGLSSAIDQALGPLALVLGLMGVALG